MVELKADEDIHLPLQGLDYWSRVAWHHERGRVPALRILSGRELIFRSPPLLFLVAPALHVHPATDTLLRYISPEIDWALLGIDERWRDGVRSFFESGRTKISGLRMSTIAGLKLRLLVLPDAQEARSTSTSCPR